MSERLSIKDTVQQWVSKINDILDLNTVDGSFRIESQDGDLRTIQFSGGRVRSGSTLKEIPGRELTFPVSKTSIVGINLNSDLIERYDLASVPGADFVPVWEVKTNNTTFYSIEDFRTWAFDDAGVAVDLLSRHVSETDPHEQYVLEYDLGSSAAGSGASLVSMEGGPTVEEAVNQRTIYVGSVAEGLSGRAGVDGQGYDVAEYHFGGYGGHKYLVFDASRAKSDHNGVTVFSPTVPAVSDQAGATLAARTLAYLQGAGETDSGGSGCFVWTEYSGNLTLEDCGFVGDNGATDQLALVNYIINTVAINLSAGKLSSAYTGDVVISDMLTFSIPDTAIDFKFWIRLETNDETVREAVRIEDNARILELNVDRNRANTPDDGVFGTQPGVRIGSGTKQKEIDLLRIKNSINEGFSIQGPYPCYVKSLQLENCGEHGIYASVNNSYLKVERLHVEGWGITTPKLCSAIKCVQSKNAHFPNCVVDDLGGNPSYASYALEIAEIENCHFNMTVKGADRLIDMSPLTSGIIDSSIEMHCEEAPREGITVGGVDGSGPVKNFILKDSYLKGGTFSKALVFSKMQNVHCEDDISIGFEYGSATGIDKNITLENCKFGRVNLQEVANVKMFGGSINSVIASAAGDSVVRCFGTEFRSSASFQDTFTTPLTAGINLFADISGCDVASNRYLANGNVTLVHLMSNFSTSTVVNGATQAEITP